MTALASGARLGPYEIVASIGAGGMGEVYKARDTRLDRLVAIKILPARTAGDPQAVARFEREARAVAALSHPNILAIHDIGHEGDIIFVVMELLDGKSLREAMPLPLKKAIDVAGQVAAGLAAAHAKGIVHRDLKPENIVLTADGSVKVLDFGLAKFSDAAASTADAGATRGVANTDAGLVLGTTGYLSPEQAQGQPVDARSDIFAFGAVLYELVSGARAFAGGSTIDTLHQIVHDTPAPVASRAPQAPGELHWVIAKCLAKDPDERYQSTRDLVVDLKKVARAVETSTSAMSLPAIAARQRTGATRWVAAPVIAVAICAAAFAWWRTSASDRGGLAPRTPTIERITSLGTVIDVNVSKDGKYVAYATSENGRQGIYLRQLATASTIELVPPRPVGEWGLAFAPDGSEIYYALATPEEPNRVILRIPTLGGTPRRIASGTDSRPVPSPDGKRLAWLRASYPQSSDSSIMVADVDGGNLRILATRHLPEFFAPIFFGDPTWSPDGKIIVAPMERRGATTVGTFVAYDAATGAEAPFPHYEFATVGGCAWMPDGKGVLVIGSEGRQARLNSQLWWIAAREPASRRRITNDLVDYRAVSVAADGTTITAVTAESTAAIWTAPIDGRGEPRRISNGRYDGISGIAAAADGHVLYRSLAGGDSNIWIMDEQGGGRRQITTSGRFGFPFAMPDRKTIVMARPDATGLWRIALDGSGEQRIAGPEGSNAPVATPDGRWIYYEAAPRGGQEIWKVSIDGGTPTRVAAEAWRPAISPDGRRIAFYYLPNVATIAWGLAVMPIDGTKPTMLFPVNPSTSYATVRWAPDGKALFHNSGVTDRANVWLQPLAGGDARQVTRFADQSIIGFDVSSDGKTLIIARGALTRDAVVLKGF